MRSLSYRRAATVAEAQSALRADPEARVLAGGQTLLPALKLRLAAPSCLVDLQGVDELRGVTIKGTTIAIGAMTTHAQVASDSGVRRLIPALAALAGGIGDRMVRHMGTLGGSVANYDPAADYPAALLALDATVVTSERRIAAGKFFRGLFETALEEHELIRAVEFPAAPQAAYVKFRHPASRFALVGAFVAMTDHGSRVAITGTGTGVFRVPEFERALDSAFGAEAIRGVAAQLPVFGADLHASAEYRASLVPEMVRRALVQAVAR